MKKTSYTREVNNDHRDCPCFSLRMENIKTHCHDVHRHAAGRYCIDTAGFLDLFCHQSVLWMPRCSPDSTNWTHPCRSQHLCHWSFANESIDLLTADNHVLFSVVSVMRECDHDRKEVSETRRHRHPFCTRTFASQSAGLLHISCRTNHSAIFSVSFLSSASLPCLKWAL